MNQLSLIKPLENEHIKCAQDCFLNYIKDNNEALSKFDQTVLDHFYDGVNVLDYNGNDFKNGKSIPIRFVFDFQDLDSVVLVISNISNTFNKRIVTSSKEIDVANLFPQQTYVWHIESMDGSIKTDRRMFSIEGEYRLVYTPNGINIRDIGGKTTIDGKKVKYGMVYRGAELTRKTYSIRPTPYSPVSTHVAIILEEDLPYLYELGIKVDLDLRLEAESNNITKSPISDKHHRVKYYRKTYDGYQKAFEYCSLDDFRKRTKDIFEILANADKNPVYVHCWGGADRTGTVCFMLEALLGVQLKDLVMDYEITSFSKNITRAKKFEPSVDAFFRENDNFYLMCEWLINYRKKDETTRDTMVRFLINEVGVKKETITKIQKIFVE